MKRWFSKTCSNIISPKTWWKLLKSNIMSLTLRARSISTQKKSDSYKEALSSLKNKPKKYNVRTPSLKKVFGKRQRQIKLLSKPKRAARRESAIKRSKQSKKRNKISNSDLTRR
jgi:hypothetical protein